MKMLNMIVAFLLELFLLAAFSYWGFKLNTGITLKVVAVIGMPLLVVVLWGKLLAPNSDTRLAIPALVAVKGALFSLGSLALMAAGKKSWAVALIIAFVVSETLALTWGQETH